MLTMRSTRLFLITTFSFFTLFQFVIAQDEPPEFKGVGVNFGPSNNSFGLLSADPSNSNVNMESVNLYTGQHSESFALQSISARGGLGVSLALEYNGNVYMQAREENRKAQASPFGLGFSMAMPSIVVHHGGTTNIYDDEYKLIVNGTAYDLKSVLSNDTAYVTQDDQPWRIYRRIDTVANWETVIGWTILREDGTVYKFGDFADTLGGWNATRNILRYGNFVGAGVAVGDTAYPSHWDLKRIEDVEGFNWIEIKYLHESGHVKVQDGAGTSLVNSDNAYTRATYIDEIETSDGKKILFSYKTRNDVQTFDDLNNYEFFYSKALSEIRTIGKYDDTLSLIRFVHQEFAPYNLDDSTFGKLLLKSIKRYSADEIEELPEISFNYFLDEKDSRYLRLSDISYPNGAVKEIYYDTLASADNFTKLDAQVGDSINILLTGYSYKGIDFNFLQQGNVFLLRVVDTVQLGYWDGYWKVDTFTAQMNNARDLPAITPQGLAVIPNGDTTVIIKRWMGGYWKSDTLFGGFLRYGSEHVSLFAGRDCFMYVTGPYDTGMKTKGMRRAYYSWWNGQDWKIKLIAEQPEEEKHWFSASIGINTFAISAMYWDNCGIQTKRWQSYFYYGIWDRKNDSVIIDSLVSDCSGYSLSNRYLVGADFVAMAGNHNINLWRWDGNDWDFIAYAFGTEKWVQSLSPLSNGLCYAVNQLNETDSILKLGAINRIPGGFRQTNSDFDGGSYNTPVSGRLWGSRNALIFQGEINSTIALYRWTGLGYGFDHYINSTADNTHSKAVFLFGDSWTYGPSASDSIPDNYNLYLNNYLGDGTWSSKVLATSPAARGVSASDWYSIYRKGDTSFTAIHKPFYYGQNYRFSHVDTVEHHSLWSILINSRHIASTSAFGIEYAFKTGQFFPFYYYAEHFVYKLADTLFVGKPPILVVDSVVIKGYPTDPDPILKTYEYFGGLLDEQATTPRFAEVKVATPYFASDLTPIGYTVNLFYNDIDDSSFYDTLVYSGSRTFPDLEDSTTFGITNGGYRLDGRPYLTYSYTHNDSGGFDDSARSYFRLIPNDTVYNVYRVVVDSIRTYKNEILSKTQFTYNTRNWRVIETKTPHKADSSFIIDSAFYAYTDTFIGMGDDNAVVQVSKRTRYYESNDSTVLLSIDSADYALKGSWKPVRSYAFPDFGSLGSFLVISDTLDGGKSFDTLGNMIASKNLAGTVSGTHLSPDGVFPVTTFSNANPEEVIVFDAEYGFENSKWEILDTSRVSIIDSMSFTGDKSIVLEGKMGPFGYDACSLFVSGDSLNGKNYFFSMWVKNAALGITFKFTAFDGGGTCLNESINQTGSMGWSNFNKLIDLSGCSTIDSLIVIIRGKQVQMLVDDIRFHPIDAEVSTSTFDSTSGLVLSNSTTNNFPIKYEYDKLHRLVNTFDYEDNLLIRNDFYFAKQQETRLPFGLYAVSNKYRGVRRQRIIVDHGQYVSYHLELYDEDISGNISYSKVYKNDVLLDSIAVDDSAAVLTIDDSVLAIAGDVFLIDVYIDSLSYDPDNYYYSLAYVGHSTVSDKEYDPEKPNYVQTTNYREIGDPFRSVTFNDGLGRILQGRGDQSNGQTGVSGWKQDVFGRTTKTYKNYLEDDSALVDTNVKYDTLWFMNGYGDILNHDDGYTPDSAKADSIIVNMSQDCLVFYYFEMIAHSALEGCYLIVNDTVKDSLTYPEGTSKALDACPYRIISKYDSMFVYDGDEVKFLSINTATDWNFNSCDTQVTYCDIMWDFGCVQAIDTSEVIDTINVNGVTHFDNDSSMQATASAYYSATGPGPDCKGYPYSESVYEDSINGQLIEQAMPGSLYSVDEIHTTLMSYETDTANQLYRTTVFDPDSIKSVSETDHWGLTNKLMSFYHRGESEDTIKNISNSDFRGRAVSVFIDTGGTQDLKLREYFYNDRNQQDSLWKVDYGTIRMIYDSLGHLRFMQNDKRKDENRFVYFKYDEIGRKIEEGRMTDGTTYFNQAYADTFDFPDTSNSPVVRYHWYYDSYNGDSIVAPGKLVRVESGDTLYYKEFYYFPEDDSELVVIDFPMPAGVVDSLKAIKKQFNWDGSLRYKTIYPNYPSNSGLRALEYLYNDADQIRIIKSNDLLPAGIDSFHFVEYEYNAVGAIETATFDVLYSSGGSEALQKVDYTYNTLGALISLNHPDSVVDSLLYGIDSGEDNDHFGINLTFYDSASGLYTNGRVYDITTTNSTTSGTQSYHYEYLYNELGWLTQALDTLDATNDRYFYYNAMGNRDSVIFDTNKIAYEYYAHPTADSGTSRIARTSDMPIGDSLFYDVLGNLESDSANGIRSSVYDYRNLLWAVGMDPNLSGGPNTSLTFVYDQVEQRIMKRYTYYYLGSCGGLPQLGPMGPGGGGPDTCVKATNVYTYYLYDDGALLATFDGADNVIDMFVNGPQGRIASFSQNDDTLLNYYFTDHLGSTRMTMLSRSSVPTPTVSSWYNYNPFGSLIASYESYSTPFRFTTKEFDDEEGFDHYYFGARYYNPELGRFSQIDKAGQFASGFVYGGNNPTLGVDPDGNLFFLATPFLIGALVSGASYAAMTPSSDFDFGKFLGSMAIGGLSGTFGSLAGKAVGGGWLGGAAGGLVGGASQGFGMAHMRGLTGDQVWSATWKGGLSGSLGGASGSLLGKWTHSGGVGAFSGGFVGGATGSALNEGNVIQGGLIGAAVATISYNIETTRRHARKTGNNEFDRPENRSEMAKAAQKSFDSDLEEGGWLRQGTDPERFPTGANRGINPTPRPNNASGIFHTHPNVGGGAVPQHSPADIGYTNRVARVDHFVIARNGNIYLQTPNQLPSLFVPTSSYLMIGYNYYSQGWYGHWRKY